MSVHTSVHIDTSAKSFTFERSQDVEAIIEANKQAAASPQSGDWGRHVARIPNIFLEQWLNEEYARGNVGLRLFTAEFDRLIARKLQDPDWQFLRVNAPSAQAGWRGRSS